MNLSSVDLILVIILTREDLIQKLQIIVQNCAARLIMTGRKCDHITPVQRELHRLRVNDAFCLKFCFHLYSATSSSTSLHTRPTNYLLSQTRTQSLFMCFGGERRLGIRLRRARGLMGRDEGKIATGVKSILAVTFCNLRTLW